MTSRLNARIDAPLAKKVAALRRTTGQTTTDVVRVALERYYDSVEREARPYDVLLEAGFIGCAEGPVGLSEIYKDELTRSLEEKVTRSGQPPSSTKSRPRTKAPRRASRAGR